MWGGSVALAYALQGIASSLALCAAAWTWRSACDQAALLVIAALLASPHVLDYDLVMLAVAIAFFVRHGMNHGFHELEISVLAAIWAMPMLSRTIAASTGLPLGLLGLLVFFVVAFRRVLLHDLCPTATAMRHVSVI